MGWTRYRSPFMWALYTIMIRSLLFIFFVLSCEVNSCPLAGTWLTDVERTSESLKKSKLVDPKKIEPIISILDEWEWVITCDKWTINHVGDHKFPEAVPSETSNYTWRAIDNQIEIESEFGDVTVFTIETQHCVSMFDNVLKYKEYKCREK